MDRRATLSSQPATDDDPGEVLEANGIADLDEIPSGARVFYGWGELLSELGRGSSGVGEDDADRSG